MHLEKPLKVNFAPYVHFMPTYKRKSISYENSQLIDF